MKPTPEQTAYRISRVQAALKGRPATEAQRKARADGLRKAWEEWRIKPSCTPESIAKTAAKLRGRKRPKELMERIRQKNIGKKRTPEQVEAIRKRVIDGYAEGRYRTSREKIEERNRKISEATRGRVISWQQRRRHSEVMAGRKWSNDIVERRAAPMPRVSEAMSDSVWRVPKPTSLRMRASMRAGLTSASMALSSSRVGCGRPGTALAWMAGAE